MKILVSVAVWGRSYAATFCDDSLASQLSPGNLPALAAAHSVTYHIITRRKDAPWLMRQRNIHALGRICSLHWDFIEDHQYDPHLIPARFDDEKYPFLSRLQNIAFARSLDHDTLIFNYADFIWADGALPSTIAMMTNGVDAVLGFCLPVDRASGARALVPYRLAQKDMNVLAVPSRTAAGLAIDHMHREARLRFWDGASFTIMPTYVIWPVAPEGLLIRAYHQTVLALRVRRDDPDYCAGIRRGSLDGYFSELLAERSGVQHATDSDTVMIFSLYHSPASSAAPAGKTREDCLRDCLRTSIGPCQRRFAEGPFLVRRSDGGEERWAAAALQSWATLSAIHAVTPPDPAAFESVYAVRSDLAALDSRWRRTGSGPAARMRMWLYRKVVVQAISGPAGRFVRCLLGRDRARAVWSRLNAWFFGEDSAR